MTFKKLISRFSLKMFALLPLLALSTAHAMEDEDDDSSKGETVTCAYALRYPLLMNLICEVNREGKPWIDEKWISEATYRRVGYYCHKVWPTKTCYGVNMNASCYKTACSAALEVLPTSYP